MVTRVPVMADVIAWARDYCGLSQEEAANRLGIRVDHLQKIELGELLPSATTFREMARVYLLPEATLLAVRRPEVPAMPTDHRTFDGARAALTYKSVAAIRRVQDRLISLEELAEADSTIQAPNLPTYRLQDDAENAGATERARFRLTVASQLRMAAEKALLNWRLLLEDTGVSVFVEDFPLEDARGISLFHAAYPAIILNRNEKQAGARLFTLIHEYAHVLLRNTGISDLNRRSKIEAWCNRFAAAFLVPPTALKSVFNVDAPDFKEPYLDRLAAAANALNVTVSMLALRLEELGYASVGYYSRIRAMLTPPTPPERKRDEDGGGPAQKYLILGRVGHRFAEAVLISVERGHISRVEGGRLINASPSYFESLRDVIGKRRAALPDVG